MSKIATKAVGNVFYEARFASAKRNDKFCSREGAAEELGIDRTRLAKVELGILVPYPEEVLLMAEVYHSPEIKNFFCRRMCSLGCDMPELQLVDLDRISIQVLSTFRRIAETKDTLLNIVEDGIITDEEKPQLERVLKTLEDVASMAITLKVWVEKNLR